MYQEVPKQSRVIERIITEQENFRHSLAVQRIRERKDVNNPSPLKNDTRYKPNSQSATRKNKIAFDRFIEIERQNRALLNKMSRIMQNDYKSDVKNIIAHRKYSCTIYLSSST